MISWDVTVIQWVFMVISWDLILISWVFILISLDLIMISWDFHSDSMGYWWDIPSGKNKNYRLGPVTP